MPLILITSDSLSLASRRSAGLIRCTGRHVETNDYWCFYVASSWWQEPTSAVDGGHCSREPRVRKDWTMFHFDGDNNQNLRSSVSPVLMATAVLNGWNLTPTTTSCDKLAMWGVDSVIDTPHRPFVATDYVRNRTAVPNLIQIRSRERGFQRNSWNITKNVFIHTYLFQKASGGQIPRLISAYDDSNDVESGNTAPLELEKLKSTSNPLTSAKQQLSFIRFKAEKNHLMM